MPVSFFAEGPDSEDLNSVFSRDEWGYGQRIMLDVAFSSLAEVLGSEDDPIESIAVPRLLAVAYAIGWSGKMLSARNPVDFAGKLESEIDARGGFRDIGAVADANLATAQGLASNQIQLGAIDLYKAVHGSIEPFAGRVTALPGVEDGLVDCSSFPRLAKLAGRGSGVSEAKLRTLAGRTLSRRPAAVNRPHGCGKGEMGLGLGVAGSVHHGTGDRVARAGQRAGQRAPPSERCCDCATALFSRWPHQRLKWPFWCPCSPHQRPKWPLWRPLPIEERPLPSLFLVRSRLAIVGRCHVPLLAGRLKVCL